MPDSHSLYIWSRRTQEKEQGAAGLFVAIPAVMAFNYFTGRVEAFDVEMDNSSSELIDYFIKQSHKR